MLGLEISSDYYNVCNFKKQSFYKEIFQSAFIKEIPKFYVLCSFKDFPNCY